jgi:hypothetical protein
MSGKHQDQVHKDKLSTDYKQRLDDERINAEDKQKVQESRTDSKIPAREDNPALEELKEKRAEQAEES